MTEEIRSKFVPWRLHSGVCTKPPSPLKKLQDDNICGVGVKLALGCDDDDGRGKRRVVVDSVLVGGPAAKVGLKEGDVVVEVDGQVFAYDQKRSYVPNDVATAIRGPDGTTVAVVVERDGIKVEFEIKRGPIFVIPTPSSSLSSPVRGSLPVWNGIAKDVTEPASPAIAPYDEMRICGVEVSTQFQNRKNERRMQSLSRAGLESSMVHNAVKAASDIRDSLELSIESKRMEVNTTADLASSSESADQFDDDVAFGAVAVATARPRPSSVLSVKIASEEEKSSDEFDEDEGGASSSVNGSIGSSQWEMLSERSGSAIVVSFSGSYCGSAPSLLYRSPSPSMLKNKFVLTESNGEPYLNHVVLPTDTLQGLCLAYKISATRLRMENGFSGNSLQMAPKRLRIPTCNAGGGETSSSSSSSTTNKGMMIRTQDQTSREYKLYAFVADIPTMELVEAKAYLDLSNWDLDEALRSAREDEGWSLKGDYEPLGVIKNLATTTMMMNAVAKPKALTACDIFASAAPPFDGHGFEMKDINH